MLLKGDPGLHGYFPFKNMLVNICDQFWYTEMKSVYQKQYTVYLKQ